LNNGGERVCSVFWAAGFDGVESSGVGGIIRGPFGFTPTCASEEVIQIEDGDSKEVTSKPPSTAEKKQPIMYFMLYLV
jgi:hypothetical protein